MDVRGTFLLLRRPHGAGQGWAGAWGRWESGRASGWTLVGECPPDTGTGVISWFFLGALRASWGYSGDLASDGMKDGMGSGTLGDCGKSLPSEPRWVHPGAAEGLRKGPWHAWHSPCASCPGDSLAARPRLFRNIYLFSLAVALGLCRCLQALLWLRQTGAPSSCGGRTSHCNGFS